MKQRKELTPNDIDFIANKIDEGDFKRNATLHYIALQEKLVKIQDEVNSDVMGTNSAKTDKAKLKAFEEFLSGIESDLHRSLVFDTEFNEDGSLRWIYVILNSTPSRPVCMLKLVGKVLGKSNCLQVGN